MTEKRPEWGIQINVWRWNKQTVCLDWRTIQTGWLTSPPARGQHIRLLLGFRGDLTPANQTLLAQRMAMFVLGRKKWRVTVPKGLPYKVVGDDSEPVPPGGGEGGEKPEVTDFPMDTLEGIDGGATIISPPPPVKPEIVSEPKARRRSPSSKRATAHEAAPN